MSPEMIALDASAITMKNNSRFVGTQPKACITGAESIS
jgi:hypothetical protein